MEIKSCNINNGHFFVWYENHGFPVEDVKRNQKAHAFFYEKTKVEEGTMSLAKFRSKEGWSVELAFWSSSGGGRNIHIPTGVSKKGWDSFAIMTCESWKLQNSHPQNEFRGEELVYPMQDRPHSKSYAEVVKSNNSRTQSELEHAGKINPLLPSGLKRKRKYWI